MKTEEMIESLAKNLKPDRGADSLRFFLLKTFCIAAFITIISWLFLPIRADFHLKLVSYNYYYESALWLLTASMAILLVYYSSIPGLFNRWFTYLSPLMLLILALVIPLGTRPHASIQEELNLVQGICGGLITIISAIGSVFLFKWAKKNAPTNYAVTGFGIAVATASLGSLLMQLVCAHDTVLHIYIWHFIPTLVLAGLGAIIGKKILRW